MPVAFWLLRLAIRLLGLVSPALAGRWVYRLRFQPLRFPEPPQEQEWRRTAQPLAVVHRGRRLAPWGAGPVVLLAHGWNGRGARSGIYRILITGNRKSRRTFRNMALNIHSQLTAIRC